MKKALISLLLLVPILTSLGQSNTEKLLPIGVNKLIIEHQYYSLSYRSQYKQAEWVAYQISDSTAFGNQTRSNNFKEDSETKDGSLKPYYSKSGYDRGHLCPAGSMAFTSVAMSESFFMSNMSPQVPGFNRGIWKKLESQVRTWGYENKHVYVVTGPLLSQFIDTIGIIPVPKYYYKVILDYHEPELKAIGFILENKSSSRPLTQFAVSVDSVETLTGINFFSALPDSIENSLEQSYQASLWSWKPVKVKVAKTKNSFQCVALTSTGNQCSRTVTDSNSFCWQHLPTATNQTVWICGKSKIYHVSPNHGALKRCKSGIRKISLNEALSNGLRECKE